MGPIWFLYGQEKPIFGHVGPEWAKCPYSAHMGPIYTSLLGMTFQVAFARTDIYKYGFFPHTIRDRNALPAFVISSAESSEDPVVRLTSLVRLDSSLRNRWPWLCVTSKIF